MKIEMTYGSTKQLRSIIKEAVELLNELKLVTNVTEIELMFNGRSVIITEEDTITSGIQKYFDALLLTNIESQLKNAIEDTDYIISLDFNNVSKIAIGAFLYNDGERLWGGVLIPESNSFLINNEIETITLDETKFIDIKPLLSTTSKVGVSGELKRNIADECDHFLIERVKRNETFGKEAYTSLNYIYIFKGKDNDRYCN